MARQLFLVYEIESQSQPPVGTAASRRRAGLTPMPRGCYFAKNANAACIKAASQLGRRGVFAAIQASPRKLDFRASRLSRKDIAKLTKRPKGRK